MPSPERSVAIAIRERERYRRRRACSIPRETCFVGFHRYTGPTRQERDECLKHGCFVRTDARSAVV